MYVNTASWPPLATGRKFTQPRDHLIAQLCKYGSPTHNTKGAEANVGQRRLSVSGED